MSVRIYDESRLDQTELYLYLEYEDYHTMVFDFFSFPKQEDLETKNIQKNLKSVGKFKLRCQKETVASVYPIETHSKNERNRKYIAKKVDIVLEQIETLSYFKTKFHSFSTFLLFEH
jgi:hypothetical protein